MQASAQLQSNKPLSISSDAATILYQKGHDIYQGNVIVKQNQSQLKGDKLDAYRNTQGQIYKVLVNGQPATIDSTQDNPLHAHAQTILMSPQLHHILLLGNAFAKQGNNVINAPIISYDTKKARLQAYHQGDNSVTIASQNHLG